MNQISRIEQACIDARLRQDMEDRSNVIRKAWDLVEPDSYDQDPQWLRIAASRAAKAGRLPRRIGGELVFMMLARAGYGRAIDHPAIERVDGIRKVIFEPYESSCSMDTARRIAAELAIRLECDARVSLCSWHYPGFTIRITLAPSPTFVPVATVAPHSNGMTNGQMSRRWANAGPTARLPLWHSLSTQSPQRMGPPPKFDPTLGCGNSRAVNHSLFVLSDPIFPAKRIAL